MPRYFVRLQHALSATNKLQKAAYDYVKQNHDHRILDNDEAVISDNQKMIEEIEKLNKIHSRCNPLVVYKVNIKDRYNSSYTNVSAFLTIVYHREKV